MFAQAAYTVGTDWPQFGYSGRRKGADPYENVLPPSAVAGIDQDWSFTTGGAIASGPAIGSLHPSRTLHQQRTAQARAA